MIETGVMEADCAKIMQEFFRQSRERKKEAKRLAKLEVVHNLSTVRLHDTSLNFYAMIETLIS